TDDAFHLEGQKIPCPSTLRDLLHVGQHFDLGIRPEHIRVSEDAHLITEVSVVEPLGRETLVRVRLPTEERSPQITLNVQVSPDLRVTLGDRLPLSLDLDRLFLFDPITGQRAYPKD
ncbi:MAG: TOBE domain-containing protein, partial [Phormidesmis sp. CAN_BIN44]|nr:TOBE domain-containing protein [Phormidesmis sp. CAN_BIN44]